MPILSNIKFAALCGVSKQAISKAIKNGHVIRGADGVDTDEPVNVNYLEKQMAKSESAGIEPEPVKSEIKPPVIKKPSQQQPDILQSDSVDIKTVPDNVPVPLNGTSKINVDGITLSEANLRRTIAQTEKTQLEVELKRKDYVNKKLVADLFSRLYEIDQAEFLTIKDKLIPDLAAIFGVTDPDLLIKAGARMDAELWKILNHIKREIDKWLGKVGVKDAGG